VAGVGGVGVSGGSGDDERRNVGGVPCVRNGAR